MKSTLSSSEMAITHKEIVQAKRRRARKKKKSKEESESPSSRREEEGDQELVRDMNEKDLCYKTTGQKIDSESGSSLYCIEAS